MAIAKCNRCGATATASTFSKAVELVNHAIGRYKGIKCGSNIGKVFEVKEMKDIKEKIEQHIEEKPKTKTIKKNTSKIADYKL